MTLKEFAIELPSLLDEARHTFSSGMTEKNMRDLKENIPGSVIEILTWRNHLHNMIESDDPVKYLKENS